MANEAETLIIRVKLLDQRQFAAGTAAARAEIAGVAKEAKIADMQLSKASFHAGLLGSAWHKLSRAAHGVGLGLIAAGIAGGVAGVHFEQEMAKVGSVVKLTGSSYKQLSQMALSESTKTRFSATQAAEAMYLLGRAGFHANEIMRALPGTLALAHASGIDLASAARIQTEALRGFNLRADETGRVADVMARATRGGNVSMADLQYTIKYVGAASFATGQKMENMVGLIETLARHGIRGTQAGTTLRTMLTRLVDPVQKTSAGLALMNMHSKDLYGPHGLLPLPAILDKMRVKLKALDPVSRERAIHQVFGQWAFSGASAILNTDPAITAKFIRDLNNAKGTAKSMADTLNNTVQMQLLRMWHTIESIGIGIYMAFRIPIKNALKDVNAWLQPFVLQMGILQMFIKQGDWGFLVTYLDNMTHSGGRLSMIIWFLVDALKVTWTFVKNVLLPVAKQWALIFAGVLYIALKGLVAIMRLANHHTAMAKFLIGLLILAYIHWKVYTLIVVGVQKTLAAVTALNLARTRLLRVATMGLTAVQWLGTAATAAYTEAWLFLNVTMMENPIILIIVGLVLLGIAFYLAYTKVKWFHHGVIVVWGWIKDNWPLLAVILFGPFGLAAALIIQHWHTLYNFFRRAPERLASIGGHMWDWLKNGFITVINYIIGIWNSLNWKISIPKVHIPGLGDIGGGSFNIGVGHISPIGQAAAGGGKGTSASQAVANYFPPKVLDPMAPGHDARQNPLINPTISVQVDGKEIAKAVHKHDSTKRARGVGH